jgi:hypothetical protein
MHDVDGIRLAFGRGRLRGARALRPESLDQQAVSQSSFADRE